MPRHRFGAFITPAELCARIADEASRHGGEVYVRTEAPARLVHVPLGALGATVACERVREIYYVLGGAGPEHDQDWQFQTRNRGSFVTVRLGVDADAVEPTTFAADPEGVAMVLIRDLERAVSRHCNKYVRVPQTGRLERFYWSPTLAGRHLFGREAVPDDVASIERAAASAKRRPKWRLRPPTLPNPVTYRQEGKHRYGASVDDLRSELLRSGVENGRPVDAFLAPSCPCASVADARFVACAGDDGAQITCVHCGREQAFGTAEPCAVANFCHCVRQERAGEVLVGGSFYPGSEDVRWIYLAWRAPECGLLRVFAHWQCDGSTRWAELLAAHGSHGSGVSRTVAYRA